MEKLKNDFKIEFHFFSLNHFATNILTTTSMIMTVLFVKSEQDVSSSEEEKISSFQAAVGTTTGNHVATS